MRIAKGSVALGMMVLGCAFEPVEGGGAGSAATLGTATSGSASASASETISGTRTADGSTSDEPAGSSSTTGSPTTTSESESPFSFRRRLGVIDDPAEDIRDLVVLVSLNDSRMSFDQAKPDGSDVVFISADGSSRFAHEIESYDADAGTATIWVQVPLLGPSHDHMWMYYGSDTSVPAVESGLLWGDDYFGVFHMGNLLDSSELGSHASGNGVVASDGQMGDAQAFGGGGVVGLAAPGLTLAEGAASFWFRRTTEGLSSGNEMLFYASGSPNLTGFGPTEVHVHLGNSGAGIVLNFHLGNQASIIADRAFADGMWHHVFTSWRAGDRARLLVDGQHEFARNHGGGMAPIDTVVQFGQSGAAGAPFAGSIDEVRLFRAVPDEAWRAADHRAQAGQLLTYGAEEAL